MPVNNFQQARIEFVNAHQRKAVADMLSRDHMSLKVAIEETNIKDTLAVISGRGVTLVGPEGDTHAVGGKGA